jgi:hypothetical protein
LSVSLVFDPHATDCESKAARSRYARRMSGFLFELRAKRELTRQSVKRAG